MLLCGRKLRKLFLFHCRKESPCNCSGIEIITNSLDVNADWPVPGNAKKRDCTRVRYVEGKTAGGVRPIQLRLSFLCITKAHVLRMGRQVSCQHHAKQAPCSAEVLAIPVKMKPVGTVFLIARKYGSPSGFSSRHNLQIDPPDMHSFTQRRRGVETDVCAVNPAKRQRCRLEDMGHGFGHSPAGVMGSGSGNPVALGYRTATGLDRLVIRQF